MDFINYEPVLNWVTEYILKARPTTNLRFDLEYFNTASLLWLAKILKVLIRISEPDYVLIIHLYLSSEKKKFFLNVEEKDDGVDIWEERYYLAIRFMFFRRESLNDFPSGKFLKVSPTIRSMVFSLIAWIILLLTIKDR